MSALRSALPSSQIARPTRDRRPRSIQYTDPGAKPLPTRSRSTSVETRKYWTKKIALWFARCAHSGRVYARGGPSNPNPHTRATWRVHWGCARGSVMVQRPANVAHPPKSSKNVNVVVLLSTKSIFWPPTARAIHPLVVVRTRDIWPRGSNGAGAWGSMWGAW